MSVITELNKITLAKWLEQSINNLENFEKTFPEGGRIPDKWDSARYEVSGTMQVLNLLEKSGMTNPEEALEAEKGYYATFTNHSLNFFADRAEYKRILKDFLSKI